MTMTAHFAEEKETTIPAINNKINETTIYLIGYDGVCQNNLAMIRVYVPKYKYGQTVQSILWVWHPQENFSRMGYGKASGYGYCKTSAAISASFEQAGIELSEDIEGRGISLVREALYSVGEAMGFKSNQLVVIG